MIIPRQLAPTVGHAHGGVEFLKGFLLGIEDLTIFWIRKIDLKGSVSVSSSSVQIHSLEGLIREVKVVI